MNRRDFLSFRAVREPEPTFDLECHALYLRFVDASRATALPAAVSEPSDPLRGEPSASFAVPTVDDLLEELAESLARVKKLRVLDGEWLQTTRLGERVSPLLDDFRARGGQVLFDSTAAY